MKGRSNENSAAEAVAQAAQDLSTEVSGLAFSAPVSTVYNPLEYAWKAHAEYIRRFAATRKRVLFLGMNPGPWGMAQTGVPFGEIPAVRDWMRIDESVDKPAHEHPKRPIEGLACTRSEVSGRRLWGLFAERFGSPEAFFADHYVANYCPLVFMSESGANITPDKLPAAERAPLEAACDAHLAALMRILEPDWVVGVGQFAQKCAERVSAAHSLDLKITTIIHPSPASPIANREWPERPIQQLREAGIW